MIYRVILLSRAVGDIDDAYLWAVRQAPFTAKAWRDRFHAKLQTLANNPQRCGFARENRTLDFELRQLLYGKRPNIFRVLFTIDGDEVRILRIRRAQRRFLTRRELNEASKPDISEL